MRKFIVLVGNNGTGKTYYTLNHFPSNNLIIRPDDFTGDYESINKQIITGIEKGLINNKTVVLDGLNLEKSFRKQLLYFANKHPNCKKIIYDFGAGNFRSLRRLIKTRPYKSEGEWYLIHFENQKIYEKPSKDEGYDEIIEINNNFA